MRGRHLAGARVEGASRALERAVGARVARVTNAVGLASLRDNAVPVQRACVPDAARAFVGANWACRRPVCKSLVARPCILRLGQATAGCLLARHAAAGACDARSVSLYRAPGQRRQGQARQRSDGCGSGPARHRASRSSKQQAAGLAGSLRADTSIARVALALVNFVTLAMP